MDKGSKMGASAHALPRVRPSRRAAPSPLLRPPLTRPAPDADPKAIISTINLHKRLHGV